MISSDILIRAAKRSVPSFKWIVGGAALFALGAFVLQGGWHLTTLVLASGLIFVFAIALIFLNRIAKIPEKGTASLAGFLAWSIMILIVLALGYVFTSAAFDWPWAIKSLINGQIGDGKNTPARVKFESLKNGAPADRTNKNSANIRELFLTDFHFLSSNGVIEIGPVGSSINDKTDVEFRIWYDIDSKAKFIGIYVPHSIKAFDIIGSLSDAPTRILSSRIQSLTAPADPVAASRMQLAAKDGAFTGITFKSPGDSSPVNPLDFVFSGRVYVYYENDLPVAQIGALENLYESKRLSPQFRGGDYMVIRRQQLEDGNKPVPRLEDVEARTVRFTKTGETTERPLHIDTLQQTTATNLAPTDQRPWIAVDISVIGPLTYNAQGQARITVQAMLKNVGRIPATAVDLHMELVPLFGDPRPEQKRVADSAKASTSSLGFVLFPDSSKSVSYDIGIEKSLLEKFDQKMAAQSQGSVDWNPSKLLLVSLVGCVDYKFAPDRAHHQTGFAYDLHRKGVGNISHTVGTPSMLDMPIRADDLVLVPSMAGMISFPPD